MQSFTANVVSGSGRGKAMGFGTINIDMNQVALDLPTGVLACFVQFENTDTWYMGALHHGQRPVFNDSRSCEVHIIDTVVAIAPERICIHPIQKIRDVQNFENPDALILQIHKDIDTIRTLLQKHENLS